MRLRSMSVLVVAGTAVAVAGCGSGSARLSKAAYGKTLDATLAQMGGEMNAAYSRLSRQLGPGPFSVCSSQSVKFVCTVNGARTAPPAARRRAAADVKHAIEGAADRLAALKPPSNVVSDNTKLVAGLHLMADVYSGLIFPRVNAKQFEAEARAINRSATVRNFTSARADLDRKGYKLDFLAPGAPAQTVRVATGGGTGYGVTSIPISVKPLPFSLVTRAGVQPASTLSAYANNCTSSDSGGGCAMHLVLEGTHGPIPDHLSVVRPDEDLHLSGPAIALSSLNGSAPPSQAGFLFANTLCQPLAVGRFLSRAKAPAKPGAYVITVDVEWQGTQGDTQETGLVGVLVSRTRPLRVLPRPRCP